ncbi:15977_t:CDS:1, partial [Rhizophagus irregularis]
MELEPSTNNLKELLYEGIVYGTMVAKGLSTTCLSNSAQRN